MGEGGSQAPSRRRAVVASSAFVLVVVIAAVFSSGQGPRAGELVQKLVRAQGVPPKAGAVGAGRLLGGWIGGLLVAVSDRA